MTEKVIPTLGFYKLHKSAIIPKFGTKGSACFDIAYQPKPEDITVPGYNINNGPLERVIDPHTGSVDIMPGERLLLPTSLILDIPVGYSVRAHPRSGLSIKQGLNLINCEGVIDYDYFEEFKISLFNNTERKITIQVGDRLCQGELVKMLDYKMAEITVKPTQKTDRVGGHGSTGVGNNASYS